jgi:HSP20 family protein
MRPSSRQTITKVIKPANIPTRNMSLLFSPFYAPVRCGPSYRSRDIAPLFSLFDDTLNEINRASRQARKQWNPRFDIKETKEAYTVDAELPGVEQENIAIEFTDEHTLTIKGRSERNVEKGKRPESVTAAETPKAVEDATATPSETGSVKSHQATVEDDAEEPANASAAQEQPATEATAAEKAPEAERAKPEEPKEQYWYSERRVGEFSRSFKFASRVDQEAVKASLKNGVLSIIVPKAAAPESRRITIE